MFLIKDGIQQNVKTLAIETAESNPQSKSIAETVATQIFETQGWNHPQSGWNIFADIFYGVVSYFRKRQVVQIVKTTINDKKLELLSSVIARVENLRSQNFDPSKIKIELQNDNRFKIFKENELHLLSRANPTLLRNKAYIKSRTWQTAKQVIRETTDMQSVPRKWLADLDKISDKTLKKATDYYSGSSKAPLKSRDAQAIQTAHIEISADPSLLNLLPKRLRSVIQTTIKTPRAFEELRQIKLVNHAAYKEVKSLLSTEMDVLNKAAKYFSGASKETPTEDTTDALIDAHFALRKYPELKDLLPKEYQNVLENTENAAEIAQPVEKLCKKALSYNRLESFIKIQPQSLLAAEESYLDPSKPAPSLEEDMTLVQAHSTLKRRPELLHLLTPEHQRFITNTQNSEFVVGILEQVEKIEDHPEYKSVLPLLLLSAPLVEHLENFFNNPNEFHLNFELAHVLVEAFVALEKDQSLLELLPKGLQDFVRGQNKAKFLEAIKSISSLSPTHQMLAPFLLFSEKSLKATREGMLSKGEYKVLINAYFAWKSSISDLDLFPHTKRFFESLDTDETFQSMMNYFVESEVLQRDPNFHAVSSSMLSDTNKILEKPNLEKLPEIERYNDQGKTHVSFGFDGQIAKFQSNQINSICDHISSLGKSTAKESSRNLMLQHLVWNGQRPMIASYSSAIQELSHKEGQPLFEFSNSENFVHIHKTNDDSFVITNLCNGTVTTAENARSNNSAIGTPIQIAFQYKMNWNQDTNRWDITGPFRALNPNEEI